MISAKHQKSFRKFLLLLVVLVGYFFYLSYQHDFVVGSVASLLTWSFFVLCTPIADAGFLLDFPIRLLFGVRMVITEVGVWALAILVNVIMYTYSPESYGTTVITRMLYGVLTHPFPYWSIIIISGIGTFLSLEVGDDLVDVYQDWKKGQLNFKAYWKKLVLLPLFFSVFLISYFYLFHQMEDSRYFKNLTQATFNAQIHTTHK